MLVYKVFLTIPLEFLKINEENETHAHKHTCVCTHGNEREIEKKEKPTTFKNIHLLVDIKCMKEEKPVVYTKARVIFLMYVLDNSTPLIEHILFFPLYLTQYFTI